MRYLGENNYFSFRGNICEPLSGEKFSAAEAANAGKDTASLFRRIAVSFSDELHRHIFLAFCCGAAESGAEVFMCENTDISAFKYGIPMIGADCGIYISGSSAVHLTFFGKDGFPLCPAILRQIMSAAITEDSEPCGKMVSVTALDRIYCGFISDSAVESALPLSAGISCGNRHTRKLWGEFFSDSDDSLIFQISDDQRRVNAYITETGFVSYDRLIMAYCIMLWKNGEAVYLPEDFHYIADQTAADRNYKLVRFSAENGFPAEAVSQRFLNDPLFMCVKLASDRNMLMKLLEEVPAFTSARRTVSSDFCPDDSSERVFNEKNGIVRISRSGKGLLSLNVQSCDSETAAELCSSWCDKLRRLSFCSEIFHPDSKKSH